MAAPVAVVPIPGNGWLEPKAAAQYTAWANAYKQRWGYFPPVVSSYRSYAQQAALYAGWVARKPGFNLALPPGNSTHERGLAVDLGGRIDAVSSEHTWCEMTMPSYGWKWTGKGFSPLEQWHFDYVGGETITAASLASKPITEADMPLTQNDIPIITAGVMAALNTDPAKIIIQKAVLDMLRSEENGETIIYENAARAVSDMGLDIVRSPEFSIILRKADSPEATPQTPPQ